MLWLYMLRKENLHFRTRWWGGGDRESIAVAYTALHVQVASWIGFLFLHGQSPVCPSYCFSSSFCILPSSAATLSYVYPSLAISTFHSTHWHFPKACWDRSGLEGKRKSIHQGQEFVPGWGECQCRNVLFCSSGQGLLSLGSKTRQWKNCGASFQNVISVQL